MSLFRDLFGKQEIYHLPHLRFGRYSESRQTSLKIARWDEAVNHYEKKEYTKSYIALLEYIENEDKSNLSFKEKLALRMSFELKHGSKLIFGYSNQNGFFASAKLVRVHHVSDDLYRSLLEENYALRYTRYALDDEGTIVVMLHFDPANSSPLNLYRGLREMAVICDTKDDVILADYPGTSPINMEIERSAAPNELLLKYNYFIKSLEGVMDWYEEAGDLIEKQKGLALFAFLSTIYKIDYLVKPEGKILEKINEIHAYYHHKNNKLAEKTKYIKESVQSLAATEQSAFDQEIYDTILSFGVLQDCNTEKASEIISTELNYASWYIQKNHLPEAGYILDYIASHLLFSYNLPLALRDCLHLYLEIMETSFFGKLGFQYFSKNTGLPKKKKIIESIQHCLKKHHFPLDEFPMSQLKFSHKSVFAYSYLNTLSKTNFDE